MDLPPAIPAVEPPAIVAQAETAGMTQKEAEQTLERLRKALPGTRFESAWPSKVPGLVAVRLASGQVGYADKSGRYFFLGLVFDTTTGQALDRQLDGNP